MLIAVTAVYVFFCVLLIIVVLLQQSKSGLFSGGSDTLLGASSGDVLTRTTTVLAVIFVVGAIFLSIISSGKKTLIDVDTAAPGKTPLTEEPAPAGLGTLGASNTPMAVPASGSNK
ncbi:MAG: preprotein translocase subunit SecG [Spirochaetes bacterium]|nr:preprotein translocase subunit SecG [Spirochaetota bacterium]